MTICLLASHSTPAMRRSCAGLVAAVLLVLGTGMPAFSQEGSPSSGSSLLNRLIQDRGADGAAATPSGAFGPEDAAPPQAAPPQPVPRPGAASARLARGNNPTFRTAQASTSGRRASRSENDDLDVILNRGALRIGTTLFTPYAMRDAAGTLIGHEIDLALALASDLGVEAEIVPLAAPELVDALTRGSIDVIIAAYAVTPARALRVTFTRPYARQYVHLIAAAKGAPRGRELEDFNRKDVSLGVTRGSFAERIAVELLPETTFVRYPEVQAAKTALLEGQVPLLLATTPFPEVLVAQSPEQFKLPLDRPLLETPLAFGLRGGNPDLLAYLDAWILARSMDRFLEKTRAYWIDSTDWLPRLTESPRIDRIDATVR